jgi:hypothetical protein
VTGGALPGHTNLGGFDAFLRKYDSAGTVLWTQQFGTNTGDYASWVTVDGSGNAYVVGMTGGSMSGQAFAGANDAFVRKYDGTGVEQWTRLMGSSGDDYATTVSVETSGSLVLAGFTNGTLPGQISAGGDDAFVARIVP